MNTLLGLISGKFPGVFTFAYRTAARILRRFPYTPRSEPELDEGPEWLVVRPSQIPNAGNGLYTTRLCPAGSVLCEYTGNRLNALQLLRTPDWSYIYNFQYQFWIDAQHHPRVKARFVNDHHNPEMLNVRWVERDDRVFLEAMRDIRPEEELYVEYGADYWTNHEYWSSQNKMSDDKLCECLGQALDCREGLKILRRSRIRSFHHHLERVRVAVPAGTRMAHEEDLFVRIYGGQISWSDVTRRDLPEREWAAWNVARRCGLPLPKTLWHGYFEGQAVAVQECVPGKTLWRSGTDQTIKQAAALLAKMHGAELEEQDRVHLADARVAPLLERLADWAAETGDDLSIRAVQTLQSQALELDERPAAFLHGDCHPANFLVDGPHFSAVIDWEESSFGDPRLDVATMDTYLRWLGHYFWWIPGKTQRFAELYLRSYCEAAGWDTGDLTFWKRLVDTRTLVVAEWIGHRTRLGLSFPATNASAWISLGRYVKKRVQQWAGKSDRDLRDLVGTSRPAIHTEGRRENSLIINPK